LTMMLMKKTPLWIAAKGILAGRGADFFHCWEKAASTFDAEDIHDLRVASRRLREGFALFAPCYPEAKMHAVRRSIKKVTDLLGELRNLDEWLAFFRAEAAGIGELHHGELSDRMTRYEADRERAGKKLKRDLKKLNSKNLRKLFARTVHAPFLFDPPPGATDPFTPIDDFARTGLELRLAPVLALVPAARCPGEAEAQHRLRIAVKRFRYRMEVLSPLTAEAGYCRVHGQVKEYQEMLGRIHDLDVFDGLIREAALSGPAAGAMCGIIAERRAESFARFLDKLETDPFDAIGAAVRSLL